MKLYFLVEGISTEMQVIPYWVSNILPQLRVFENFSDYKQSNDGVFYISGYGYPSILKHINNSALDLILDSNTDYFFVILDADEDDVATRNSEIDAEIAKHNLPENLQVVKVIQNRCFETILLGNQRVIPRQPQSRELAEFIRYYNVCSDDPEFMGKLNANTHSQFHTMYLRKALYEKRIRYSKNDTSEIRTEDYFNALIRRVTNTNHLANFKSFIDTLQLIAEKHE